MQRHETSVPEHLLGIRTRVHLGRQCERPRRDPRGRRNLGEVYLRACAGTLETGEGLNKLGRHGLVHPFRLRAALRRVAVPRRYTGVMTSLAPVFLGSDLGVYSMARQFHEEFGCTSTTIAKQPRGFINDSAIVRTVILGADATPSELLAAADRAAEEARASGARAVLMVNSDSQVDFVNAHREHLEARFTVLVPPPVSVDAVSDKSLLAPLARKVGLKTPREATIGQADDVRAATSSLQAPYILKPATSTAWETLGFPGKLKVYVCETVDDVREHCEAAWAGGYTGTMLLQELIPGDDTAGYVTTQYVDSAGRVTIQATARMLLAIHTPNLLGNMALGLVEWYPEFAEPIAELLTGIGYRGFATADIKVHARTGERYLLDINPRIGRSNYFLPIGGVHPMRAAMDDADGRESSVQRTNGSGLFRIVPTALLSKYVTDGELVRRARGAGRAVHPLDYARDRNLRRTLFRHAASLNHVRNLAKVYPRPTETSF